MNDLLTRAWHALTPEQRPNGMEDCCGWCERGGYDTMPDHTVYDRLCVACENVLLGGGWRHSHDGWYLPSKLGVVTGDTCRLTAAVLAIEEIRRGNDEC